MAITDTLVAIKEYFMNWHTTYYNDLHTEEANSITPPDSSKLATTRAVYDFVTDIQNTLQTSINNVASTFNTWKTNNWKAVTNTNNGYMTTTLVKFFRKRTFIYSITVTIRSHSVGFRREGRICICNIRGSTIPKNLDTSKTYVLGAIPSGTKHTDSDGKSDPYSAAIWKPNTTYLGSFSYDEVKWISVMNFDDYYPSKGDATIYKTDGTALNHSTATSTYPNGAIVFKPKSTSITQCFATITYWCQKDPEDSDI